MSTETLENDHWRFTILPRLGASLVALEARVGDAWKPLMRPAPPEALDGTSSSPFSSYTLAPYSNRIRDGRFTFDGVTHQLRPNSQKGETIHGDVRNRPWTVQREASSLVCDFDSRALTDANFPFPYTVRVTYTLAGDAFTTHIALENVGARAMPAGFGFHPYFVRRFAGSTQDPRLEFHATGYYITDALTIPTAGAQPVIPALDFSAPKDAYGQFLDTVFTGWTGRAVVTWDAHRMTMTASEVFGHFVAFNGAPDGTLALEPVSHATDGFNLMARGVPDTGVRVLQPGERLEGEFSLRIESL
jgi:aldose 1-epimerase